MKPALGAVALVAAVGLTSATTAWWTSRTSRNEGQASPGADTALAALAPRVAHTSLADSPTQQALLAEVAQLRNRVSSLEATGTAEAVQHATAAPEAASEPPRPMT